MTSRICSAVRHFDSSRRGLHSGSIRFYGPEPAPGDRFTCTVWNRSSGRREVRSDFELTRNGVLYARVTAWEGWRFPTGGPIFPVLRQPDRNLLAAPDPEGFVVLHDPGFMLSVLATFGLITISPTIEKYCTRVPEKFGLRCGTSRACQRKGESSYAYD